MRVDVEELDWRADSNELNKREMTELNKVEDELAERRYSRNAVL